MQQGEEIQKLIWEGSIPLIINLGEEMLTNNKKKIQPFYTMSSRMSYLFTISQDIINYFEDALKEFIEKNSDKAIDLEKNLWLDFNKIPLKWYQPTGVLYDTITGEMGKKFLPWELTAHFTSFPDNILFKISQAEMEQLFFHSFKESCFLLCGSTAYIDKFNPLFQSELIKNAFLINQKEYISSLSQLGFDYKNEKSLATRLIYQGKLRQLPISPQNDGEETLLYQALEKYGIFKKIDNQQLLKSDSKPEALSIETDESSQFENQNEIQNENENQSENQEKNDEINLIEKFENIQQNFQIVIQGIMPPLDTPCWWLAEYCKHPDGFIYIIVNDRKNR
ncbi:autophagy protein [Anaeramoeba ignava]|uniref:Autophagy protein 5 n=1 Tax=Anaeramoeba ignava TaxID=1746090 RepID=A0A9Q0LF37_ANAIG|nr:autophagy protein [Anaeramoeba ignava]